MNWVATLWRIHLPYLEQDNVPLPLAVSYLAGQPEWAAIQVQPPLGGAGAPRFHWQLYIEMNVRSSAAQVRAAFGWRPNEVWLAPRYGTQQDAIAYTQKQDSAVTDERGESRWAEIGERRGPDAAALWPALEQQVQAGASYADIADVNFKAAVMYASGLQKAIAAIQNKTAPQWRDVKVYYLYGGSGTGKTRYVYNKHPGQIYKKLEGQWWDGYEGQDVLLFDEFRGEKSSIQLEYLLQILDGYELSVNVRGSTRVARWTTVYITSNRTFDKLYPYISEEHVAALDRRCPLANRIMFPLPPPEPVVEVVNDDTDTQPAADVGAVKQQEIPEELRVNTDNDPVTRADLMRLLAALQISNEQRMNPQAQAPIRGNARRTF
jgi:hypothetical protein